MINNRPQPNCIFSETQSKRLTETLVNWKIRLNKAQIGHYISTERYGRLHYLLGVPLVGVSAFVSASLFLDHDQIPQYLRNVVVFLSITTTIIASLQTFLRLGEKSELHRAKAAKYGNLKRTVESFLAIDHTEEEVKIFLEKVDTEWSHITDDAPVTLRSIRKEVSNIFRKEEEERKKINTQ